MTIILVTIIK